MDYKAIIEGLNDEAVINLMKRLGADRYEDKGTHLIFPTICHNLDSSEASMKLYFYKDTKLFVCWTSCGTMSIFKFLKHYYEERQIDYDWYDDIYKVIIDCSNNLQRMMGEINIYTSTLITRIGNNISNQEEIISSPYNREYYVKRVDTQNGYVQDTITKLNDSIKKAENYMREMDELLK